MMKLKLSEYVPAALLDGYKMEVKTGSAVTVENEICHS